MDPNKLLFAALIFCTAFVLPACGRSNPAGRPPTASPTFELARFTTATPTSPASPTPPAPIASLAAEPISPLLPTVTPARPVPTQPATPSRPDTSPLPTPTATPSPAPPASPTLPADTPTPTSPPAPPPLSGRLAFPIDDGGGHYDIWVMELPAGSPFFVLDRARQPSFSSSGQLLVNLENSTHGEGMGLLDSNFTWLGLVSDTPEDGHPYWAPDGSRYVFDNPNRLKDPQTGADWSFIFIPCSLRLPAEEPERKCQDIAGESKLAPGAFPVWTADGRIAFFSFEGEDGIYTLPADAIARGSASGSQPQFLVAGNGRPGATHGNRLYFSAGSMDGNWEVYAVNLDGSGLANLTNSPDSQDGLPAVSPDGAWLAFVSNRSDKWGIWLMPAAGGDPQLLLDLITINSNPNPWGQGDRDWTTERLSWGP